MSVAGLDTLLVVAGNYPSLRRPAEGTFVRAMIDAYEQQGVRATVIAPRRIWDGTDATAAVEDSGPDGRPRSTLRPFWVPVSNKGIASGFSTQRLGQWSFGLAVSRAARSLGGRSASAVYAHFLFPAGKAAAALARRLRAPLFIAMGEGNPEYYFEHYGREETRRVLLDCRGILAASPDNRAFCVGQGFPEARILTLPNAANTEHFAPRDRVSARVRLGLPQDRTIVIFVGHFDENKGAARLARAMEKVPELCSVFLGSGPQRPTGSHVLKAGLVPFDQVPEWLAAADFFALPTLRECSSNALAEAAAMGLPVLSSDLANTRAMVDPAWSLLVDPRDIDAIANGIAALTRDPARRAAMARAALDHSRRYGIAERARLALAWMGELAGLRADA